MEGIDMMVLLLDCGGGAVGESVRLGSGRLCDRIPAATVVKTGSDSSTAKRSVIDQNGDVSI